MRLITYNVNGIRSAMRKGWIDWVKATDPDIICLQEIKASPDQLTDLLILEQMGYEHYWYPAKKKGYSGTAIITKKTPDKVTYGCGEALYDDEGRVITADFGSFSVMSTYFPSGTTGDIRQDFKYHFLDDFQLYTDKLRIEKPNLIISGDYNICHKEIDIHNPKSNKNSSGFLPEERAWMDRFVHSGFTDSFRHINPDPHNYTWWSFRARARERNLGWRIDYNMVSKSMEPHIKDARILSDAVHSDHCPVLLESIRPTI